jgi:hypothetical protein
LASAHDEWIELYNPGSSSLDLSGWSLSDGADIHIELEITLAPYSFALLERTDDNTVMNIAADQIYTGSLKNGGDSLYLRDPSGTLIDSANIQGGTWPAGDHSSRASMERRGGEDRPGNWATFTGTGGLGFDSDGQRIPGTPRGVNSIHLVFPTSTTLGETATPTTTSSPTPQPAYEPGSLLISEIAWAGTLASSSDEWIELYNPGETEIDLAGWQLSDDGDLSIVLAGMIAAQNYYLLERTNDQTIIDIPADLIYSGSLSNSGEHLSLIAPDGTLIDSANHQGGAWPAGNSESRASMERRGGTDQAGNWASFSGYHGCGLDVDGNPIQGTPRQINSIFFPTPAPTWIPGKLVINEILIRPHYDWEGRGGVDTGDEFIELLNLGPHPVNLRNWWLDDVEGAGSKPYQLPAKTVQPGEYAVFFRSRTHLALNDSGDTVRLIAPDGGIVDQLSYLPVRAYNLSYGRLPDGSGTLRYGLWPTPGGANLLFEEPLVSTMRGIELHCRPGSGYTWSIPRLGRQAIVFNRFTSIGFRLCWYMLPVSE